MGNTQTRNTPARDLDATVGRQAHMLMWDAKLTQRTVALQMGITPDSLSRKLKGERGWALAEVAAIADVLGTTVPYLMGLDEVGPAGIEPTTSTV